MQDRGAKYYVQNNNKLFEIQVPCCDSSTYTTSGRSQRSKARIDSSYQSDEVGRTFQSLSNLVGLAQSNTSIQKLFHQCGGPVEQLLHMFENGRTNILIMHMSSLLQFLLNALVSTPIMSLNNYKSEPIFLEKTPLPFKTERQSYSIVSKFVDNRYLPRPFAPSASYTSQKDSTPPIKHDLRASPRRQIYVPISRHSNEERTSQKYEPPRKASYIEFAPRRKKEKNQKIRAFDIITNK